MPRPAAARLAPAALAAEGGGRRLRGHVRQVHRGRLAAHHGQRRVEALADGAPGGAGRAAVGHAASGLQGTEPPVAAAVRLVEEAAEDTPRLSAEGLWKEGLAAVSDRLRQEPWRLLGMRELETPWPHNLHDNLKHNQWPLLVLILSQ